MPRRAIELSDLLSLGPSDNRDPVMILGHNQDANVIFKSCDRGEVFMVHIESLQFKKLSNEMGYGLYHPFSSFYPGGIHINAGHA
uniref:Uncharacterized protein n=1 Tax=Arundo donax TaxID=35708 RepID=A0A0A8Z2K3_ARUDO